MIAEKAKLELLPATVVVVEALAAGTAIPLFCISIVNSPTVSVAEAIALNET
jgi:hypothetical protein